MKSLFNGCNPYLAVLLIAVGSLQYLGFITDIKQLRGIGFATVASPLPLVFSHFRGMETFASSFQLETIDSNGKTKWYEIDPKTYSKLEGPYNRRNIYGAAIAYGPAMTQPNEAKLVKTVLNYGFCAPGPLKKEFELPSDVKTANIHVTSKTREKDNHWILKVDC